MVVIYLLYTYVLVGLCFVPYFLTKGVKKIHQNIDEGGFGLKLLLTPATIILWPYLLMKINKNHA